MLIPLLVSHDYGDIIHLHTTFINCTWPIPQVVMGSGLKTWSEDRIMAKGTGKNEQPSAKRDRCLDIAAEHPDAAFRPGHPEHLGATW